MHEFQYYSHVDRVVNHRPAGCCGFCVGLAAAPNPPKPVEPTPPLFAPNVGPDDAWLPNAEVPKAAAGLLPKRPEPCELCAGALPNVPDPNTFLAAFSSLGFAPSPLKKPPLPPELDPNIPPDAVEVGAAD